METVIVTVLIFVVMILSITVLPLLLDKLEGNDGGDVNGDNNPDTFDIDFD
jgi:hypothetical protein